MILGQPSPDELVVGTLRLPRMVVGLLVGAAFGIAGALIQTVARNPLASPDIIGISQGASALTVGAMTFGVTSYTVLPYLSVIGGIAAAALVYVFAWRGGLHATRFVLIGIGFAIALRSVTTLFLTKGDYLVAQQAQIWMTGSLNGRGWDEAAPLGWTLLVLVPAVAVGGSCAAHRVDGRRHRDRARRTAGPGTPGARRARRDPGVRGDGDGRAGRLRGAARPADRPPHDAYRPDPAAVLGAARRSDRRLRPICWRANSSRPPSCRWVC